MIAEFIELLNDFWDKQSREIMIGCVAKIEKHDVKTMRAEVTPLLIYTNQGKKSINAAHIPDVPVLFIHAGGFYIRPKYQKDDLVWLTFATHDINDALKSKAVKTDGKIFSAENVAIVHGIAATKWQPPQQFEEDGLVIGHKDNKVRMALTDSVIKMKAEKVTIEGAVEITGEVNASGNISTEKEIVWKSKTTPTHGSTHIHGTGVGPSAPAQAGS